MHRAHHVVPVASVDEVGRAVLAPGQEVDLYPQPEVSRLANERAVGVEVVTRPVAIPGVLPDLERLYEAVHVLGHAELLDPTLGRRLPVALGVTRGEVVVGPGAVLVR